MKREQFDNIILISLLVFTFILIFLQEYALEKELVIDASSNVSFNAVSDKPLNGNSTATLSKVNNNLLLDCNIIKASYNWPFCELTVTFGSNESPLESIDLSNFTHVNINAKYLNNTDASFRFQLRAYNPEYARLEDENTWKYVVVEYWPDKDLSTTTIPLSTLQVATWWIVDQKIPIHLSAPEFEQILVLELATGNNIAPGHYQILIKDIVFKGKLFSNAQVYGALTSIWILAALLGLYANLKRSRIKLKEAETRTVELKKLNRLLNVETKQLKDKAERDPLTGALNRSGIKDIFTQELKTLSLIFIDIDHFKPINDTHGHGIGDEVLKSFAKLISENCRATDFLARWGGEEFLLVCPNTVLSDATELAESLRLLIAKNQWVNGIELTSSFGVAQRIDESASDFIERADKALYDAKARGRNQVVVSKPSDHLTPIV